MKNRKCYKVYKNCLSKTEYVLEKYCFFTRMPILRGIGSKCRSYLSLSDTMRRPNKKMTFLEVLDLTQERKWHHQFFLCKTESGTHFWVFAINFKIWTHLTWPWPDLYPNLIELYSPNYQLSVHIHSMSKISQKPCLAHILSNTYCYNQHDHNHALQYTLYTASATTSKMYSYWNVFPIFVSISCSYSDEHNTVVTCKLDFRDLMKN